MRIVLTGASGQLGSYLARRLVEEDRCEVSAWSGRTAGTRAGVVLRPVDLADSAEVERTLTEVDPAVVVHAGAVSAIEAVRLDPARAHAVNVEATEQLADWCIRRGRRLLYTSTDLVFDGRAGSYRETDPTGPLMAYGRTKLAAEPAVLDCPGGLVARMSLMFGPGLEGPPTYVDRTIAALRRNEPQHFFCDEFRTPLDLATAAEVLVRLALSELAGLVHVGGAERLSRFELSRRIAVGLDLDPALVRANSQRDVTFPEPRPVDVSLDITRLRSLLPDLELPSVESTVASWNDPGRNPA